MRAKSEKLKQYSEIDVICVVAHAFLGITDLALMPELTSGFKSVEAVVSEEAAVALRNMRLMGFKTNSIGQLKASMDATEGKGGALFAIDKESLSFSPLSGTQIEIDAIRQALLQLPPRRATEPKYADPTRPFEIPLKYGLRHKVDLENAFQEPFKATPHPKEPRKAAGPFVVTMAEICEAAAEMDRLDFANGHTPANWLNRLVSENDGSALLAFKNRQFETTEVITLEGTSHILGLPGTGKTTLIGILVFIAARRGLRTATFTTSVAVADDLRKTQARYGTRSEILFGSSPLAKRRHAANYGDFIGAEHEDNGFGRINESAMQFATGCMLEGSVPQERFDQVPENDPPCRKIIQKSAKSERVDLLCPMIGICGRYEATRNLVKAEAWFGHPSILEVKVPPFLSEEQITYGELVARQIDIVFIDEADVAQKNLDGKGADRITLYGKGATDFATFVAKMLTKTLAAQVDWNTTHEKRVHHAAINITRHLSAFETFCRTIDEKGFERRFVNLISENILNTASIIGSLFSFVGDKTTVSKDAFYDLGTDLEGALRTIYFYDEKRDRERVGNRFHEAAASYSGTAINDLSNDWIDAITKIFGATLELDLDDDQTRQAISDHVRILCQVISCLVHVETILQSLPYVSSQDADALLRSDMFSRDMLALVAESVAGRLSGLKMDIERHPVDRTITSLSVDYQSYRGTPRLLPSRLALLPGEERGPHVVSLSATSFLPESKTYHLRHQPDYILARSDVSSSSRYKFTFAPVRSREGAVSVSGAGNDREANLRLIIRETFGDATRAFESYRPVGDERDRKMAVVVNSYAQVGYVLDELNRCNPGLRRRTIGITSEYDDDRRREDGYRTSGRSLNWTAAPCNWVLKRMPTPSHRTF